ncbi:hypothetical protein GOODEAATRI_012765 [Goodea atripinnis]|uniref:Uncharacterized protein n=1 Tax=Goodea atripinnis TaxID=208336 RepID=A0ABV0NA89_9TELE
MVLRASVPPHRPVAMHHTSRTFSIHRSVLCVMQSAQDDKATIRCETSPPTTPRSMRLNREVGHASSQEDIRDIRG